ncbi:MAG: HAD family hydrolase [Anaerolineales bacterium]
MIQGVIFDLGSTLIRFTGDWPQVFTRSLEALAEGLDQEGISINPESFKQAFKSALSVYHRQRDHDLVEQTTEVVLIEILADLIGEPPPRAAVKRALEGMYSVSQDYWHTLPTALPVLKNLDERGLRMGLISNASDEADVQRLIDKAGIRKYLQPILISAGFGLRKPHPDIFQAVLKEWDLPARDVVMVGDLLEADILGAENVGMRHIWMTEVIDTGELQPPYVVEPDAVAHRLADVPAILDSLDAKGKNS